MRCLGHSIFIALLACTSIFCSRAFSSPQSETETPAESGAEVDGGATKSIAAEARQPTLALDGYCPVSIGQSGEWVKGSPAYQATYDGHVYYFPSEKYKKQFLADPARFAPALGGDCLVNFAKTGQRTSGSVRHALAHRGRLFLFSNEEAREMFAAHPDDYTDLDLAFHGDCPVKRVEVDTRTPGRHELIARRNGFRYYFSSPESREKFLANPEKYEMHPGDEGWPGEAAETEYVDTPEEPIQ